MDFEGGAPPWSHFGTLFQAFGEVLLGAMAIWQAQSGLYLGDEDIDFPVIFESPIRVVWWGLQLPNELFE